jgi:hypothetical protein
MASLSSKFASNVQLLDEKRASQAGTFRDCFGRAGSYSQHQLIACGPHAVNNCNFKRELTS